MSEIEGLQAQVKAYQELLGVITNIADNGMDLLLDAAHQLLVEDLDEPTNDIMRSIIDGLSDEDENEDED